MSVPRTRLSTRFSGSARETENRLRSIFQWRKLRPPLALLLLAALAAALCGGLVSCQSRGQEVGLEMDTQYYDVYGNYIEIPRLTVPDGAPPKAAGALNGELDALKRQYEDLMAAPENTVGDNLCLLFPAVTQRYYSLVFYLGDSSSGSDGDIVAWVYDRRENRMVTAADALALAGVTEEELLDGLERLQTEDPEDPRAVLERSILGFRIKEDGGVVFYLSVTVDGTDVLDGWRRLYTWEDGTYDRYSDFAFSVNDIRPLVPQEELRAMDPPLWNQWFYAGGEPTGGFLRDGAPEAVMEAARTWLEGYPYYDPPIEDMSVEWDGRIWLHTAYDDLSGLSFAPGWEDYEAVECYTMSFQVIQGQGGGGELDYVRMELLFLRAGDEYKFVTAFLGGGEQSEPGRLAAPAPYNNMVMYLLLGQGILEAVPDMDARLRDNPVPSGAKSAALNWYYSQGAAERGERVYFADAAPLRPEVGDRRIDGMEYAGLEVTYETYGVAYRISSSGYQTSVDVTDWRPYSPYYLVLGLSEDGYFYDVRGEGNVDEDVQRVILEESYGLIDLEASLWRDGWAQPAGPGTRVDYFHEEPEITVLEGWEPIYNEGDSWRRYDFDGLSALCYCTANGDYRVNSMDSTRADLATWRGIRMGSTRAELEAAYSGLTADTDDAGVDCLRWSREEFYGPFLRFYLEGDTVSRIVLDNMFD